MLLICHAAKVSILHKFLAGKIYLCAKIINLSPIFRHYESSFACIVMRVQSCLSMKIEDLYQRYLQSTSVSTDSRHCPPGSIFFALKGERFDGNDYLEQVLSDGAIYAVGDADKLPDDQRIIRVDNVLDTLQQLANYHRRQMKAQVIAITGTNGKTTTKELIAAALRSQYPTLYTQGNLNNHIGVPLTLLQLKPEHEYAVIEMGANHEQEIALLCRIAEPDAGIITNIGRAHLEGFGSFEGVIRAKTELYDYLREEGKTVFANLDNPILKAYYPFLSIVGYGTEAPAFVYGKYTAALPFLSLEWYREEERHLLATHLIGAYNLENILAAICIASYYGVESRAINRSIAEYIPQNNRSQQIQTQRNKLIIDAYNANPSSMQVALENFISIPDSPKMAILGEMKELGSYSEEEHRKIVEQLAAQAPDRVILIGKHFTDIQDIPSGWLLLPDTPALIRYLEEQPMEGYTILIKGSRGNQLEKAVNFL